MSWLAVFFKMRPRLRNTTLRTIGFVARRRGFRRGRTVESRPLSVVSQTDGWVESNYERGARRTMVKARERINNTLPKSAHGFHDWEYLAALNGGVPEASVFEIPQGHVVGEYGSVITGDGEVLQDISLPTGSLHTHIWETNGQLQSPSELEESWRLAPRQLRGTAAVLTAFYGRAYFHWLFDVLPRLGLLIDSGIRLDEIKHFIVPSYTTDFQRETLSALGVPPDRIVTTLLNRHIVADRLIATSLSRPTGFVPRWVCDFLRSAFPERRPNNPVGERLYVVRRQTDHWLLPGETALIDRLHGQGFVPIALEDYTLEEKAWIMSRASAILSTSGAGLTNIVFCEPGTKVVELRVRPLPVMDGWDIANRMELDFYDVVPRRYHRDDSRTIALDPGPLEAGDVEATLEMAGCLM